MKDVQDLSPILTDGPTITVHKLDINGRETWRYPGKVLQYSAERLVLEAFFDREDRLFYGMPLCKGDRFIETYYTQQWYNIFEIHGGSDDHLRGWYCNVTRPAEIRGDVLSYVDLALDLLVFPDGRQLVLDEDEFNNLDLNPTDKAQALAALAELQQQFASNLK